MTSSRLRSLVGVVLLVSNSPFGWGCVAAAGWLATHTGEPRWLAFGAFGDGVSWAMLGLAVVLLGREGVNAVRARLRGRRSMVAQGVEVPVGLKY